MKKIAIVLLMVLTYGIAMSGSLPDTGQTNCYNNYYEMSCPTEWQYYWGQDGSYVKARSYTLFSGGQIVRDDVTNLMWEVKTDDGSIHDRDNTYSWYDPDPSANLGDAGSQSVMDTKDFLDCLNAENFGGFSDWRMPTIKELATIVNLGKETGYPLPWPIWIDEAYFPNTQSNKYWSSTTYAGYTSYAWSMNFHYGTDGAYSKTNYYYVRAVRDARK